MRLVTACILDSDQSSLLSRGFGVLAVVTKPPALLIGDLMLDLSSAPFVVAYTSAPLCWKFCSLLTKPVFDCEVLICSAAYLRTSSVIFMEQK